MLRFADSQFFLAQSRIDLSEDSKDSETIDVTIASLDDPAPFAPEKAIWLEDKLPWVTLDESLPSFPKSSQIPR